MKSSVSENRESIALAKPTFLCAYQNNLSLSNWYKNFKNYLISRGYEVSDLDVNDLLFQAKKNESPTFKIMSLKMQATKEKYYLLFPINDSLEDDYARYKKYCEYIMNPSNKYFYDLALILIFNTKRAQFLYTKNFILSHKLNVLSTSIDDYSFKLSTLKYSYNQDEMPFNFETQQILY